MPAWVNTEAESQCPAGADRNNKWTAVGREGGRKVEYFSFLENSLLIKEDTVH